MILIYLDFKYEPHRWINRNGGQLLEHKMDCCSCSLCYRTIRWDACFICCFYISWIGKEITLRISGTFAFQIRAYLAFEFKSVWIFFFFDMFHSNFSGLNEYMCFFLEIQVDLDIWIHFTSEIHEPQSID